MGSCISTKAVRVTNYQSITRVPNRGFLMTAEEKELVNQRKLKKVPILNIKKSQLYQKRKQILYEARNSLFSS